VDRIIFQRVPETALSKATCMARETPTDVSTERVGNTGKDVVRPCPGMEAQSAALEGIQAANSTVRVGTARPIASKCPCWSQHSMGY